MITDLKSVTLDTPLAVNQFVRGPGIPALVETAGNVFPMNLNGKNLVVKISTDAGVTFPTTRTHTFAAADPYTSIAAVVTDILADAAFMGGGTPDLSVTSDGNELVVRTLSNQYRALKVDAASNCLGSAMLNYSSGQVGNGTCTTIVEIVTDNNGKFILFFT